AINAAAAEALRRRAKFERALGYFDALVHGISEATTSYGSGNWLLFVGDIASIGENLSAIDRTLRGDPEIDNLREVYKEVMADYTDFMVKKNSLIKQWFGGGIKRLRLLLMPGRNIITRFNTVIARSMICCVLQS